MLLISYTVPVFSAVGPIVTASPLGPNVTDAPGYACVVFGGKAVMPTCW
jgi:hypothetical protein